MVMEYLNNSGMLKVPLPNLNLHQIAKLVRTLDGTMAHDVPAINPSLEEAIPSVEFEDDYKSRISREIEEEIANGRPCIPWMLLTDGVHYGWHAVVVTDIDAKANSITYNDPGPPAETTQPLSEFEHSWNLSWTNLVKVQIGRNTRTVLTQFK
jgi:hypothetical protein